MRIINLLLAFLVGSNAFAQTSQKTLQRQKPSVLSKFHARLDSPYQSIAAGSQQALTAWISESFDTNSEFTLGTGKFQPTVAGYYLLNCSITYIGYPADTGFSVELEAPVSLAQSGAGDYASTRTSTNPTATATVVYYFNGTTDFSRCYALNQDVSARNVAGTFNGTQLP